MMLSSTILSSSKKFVYDIRLTSNIRQARDFIEFVTSFQQKIAEAADDKTQVSIIRTGSSGFMTQSVANEQASFDDFIQQFSTWMEKIPVYRDNQASSSISESIEKEYIRIRSEIESSTTISLLQIIEQDDFVAGEISNTERFISKIVEEYGWTKTMNWLQTVFHDNFGDSQIVTGILHSISHYDYSNMNPAGVLIALGVLQHKDMYVRDYAIRAFENWNSKKAIPILESLKCEAEWQQQYINDVLETLKTEGID